MIRVPVLVAIGALVTACDSTAPLALTISLEGRVERGLTGVLAVEFEGAAVSPASVTWAAEPAGRVAFLPAGEVRFTGAGNVTLIASAEVEPGRTESGTLDVEIAVPPRIVMDLLRGGNRDIWAMDLDGENQLRLTIAPTDDEDPSAASGIVVFTSFRDGQAELYSVPIGGGAPVRLTNSAADEIHPALIAGGDRIAFTADPSGLFKLWTMDADGGGAEPRTNGFGTGGSIEASPSWEPEGGRIVFVSTTNGTADLFTLDDGGAPVELLTGGTAMVEPAWSPDGERVAFASNMVGDTELFLVEVGSGTVTRLTERAEPDGEPAWLPDGRIVFTRWTGGVPALAWLDPDEPAVVFEVPVGAGTPRRTTGVLD